MFSGKKTLFFSILLVVALSANAQIKFQRTYGIGLYNEGRSVKQTFDGGYIVAGTESGAGNGSTDVYLLKIDSLGNFTWHKTFGGSGIDQGYAVEQTSDSGYAICGYTNSFGNGGYDGYLIRTDKNGDTLWTKTYGTSDWDFIYSMIKTFDGGFVLAGNSYGFNSGNSDVFLIKTDSFGDTLWTRVFGGDSMDVANSVEQTLDTGYIVTGHTKSFGEGENDVYLIRTNSSGDTIWTRTFGGTRDDFGQSVKQTTDTGYIIAAYSNSFTIGDYNELLIKTNFNGDTLWLRNTGGLNDEIIHDIIMTSDGEFAYAGKFDGSGGGSFDFRMARTSYDGWFTWGRTFGGAQNDEAVHIEQTSDNGFIAVGFTESFGNTQKIFIVKTDSAGYSDSIVVNDVSSPEEVNNKSFDCPLIFNSSNQIRFRFSTNTFDAQKTFLKIYDFQAKLLETQPIYKNDLSCTCKPLTSGIYFYIITSNDEIICKGKFPVAK